MKDQAMSSENGRPRDLVRVATDGACSGNPGRGGWALILDHPATGQSVQASGAVLETTNNRMELTGVIEGLATLKRPCKVELITDSQYVAKGISEWMAGWKRLGWQRKEGNRLKPLSNADLWQKLDSLVSIHEVRVKH